MHDYYVPNDVFTESLIFIHFLLKYSLENSSHNVLPMNDRIIFMHVMDPYCYQI